MTPHDSPAADALPELFDSHCHLGHGDRELAPLLDRARQAGLRGWLDVGIDAETSRAARARSSEHDGVAWSAGLHPCSAERLDAEWATLEELATRSGSSSSGGCAALGETGFDFHWQPDGYEVQRRSFERHLQLATETGLPVIVHCRDAFDATRTLLAAWPDVTAIIHCFSGDLDTARRFLDLGCFLSYAGPVTYPRSDALRAAASATPPERTLIETDAPFLPPRSKRGKANESSFLPETARIVAECQGVDVATLARTTTANARALLNC